MRGRSEWKHSGFLVLAGGAWRDEFASRASALSREAQAVDAEPMPQAHADDGVAAEVMTVPAWVHNSTLEVAADVRFEYHRTLSLAMGAHVEPPHGGGRDFFAQARSTGTPDGIGFVDYEVDPCTTHFGSGADDSVVEIGLLYAGHMRVRHGKNQTSVLRAGDGPVLFDAARPLSIQTPRCAGAHLYVPRAAVVAALGGDAVPRGMALRPLPADLIGTQLVQCLRSLHGESSRDMAQITATLHTAQALALVALANTRGAGHHWPGELEAALYAAACHQLAQHVANPRVTVDAVASALQCSRAQLYRLFAARGRSVASYLRELRMQRAVAWLAARPALAIGVISDGCGYSDLVNFDKAFRRRFGMTPRDWRARHAQGADAHD